MRMSCINLEESPTKLIDLSRWIPDFYIGEETRRALSFRENLIVSLKDEFTTNTNPIGSYCISVESIGPRGSEFLVHLFSSMTVDGCFSGSKVISSATEKFHCLEEKRTEFTYKSNGLHERVLFIGLEDDAYYAETTHTCPCDIIKTKVDLPSCLISEGANVLLMRYFAVMNFEGAIPLQSVSIEGRVTTCNYRCTSAKYMKMNGRGLNVYTVERRLHEECGLVQNVKTYMTEQGRILRHDWEEVPYLLQLNPLVDPRKIAEGEPDRLPLKEYWTEDMEMMSKYLDTKTCKIAQHTEYLADHPEVKQLIADFTQNLLVGNQLAIETGFLPNLFRQLSKSQPQPACPTCGVCKMMEGSPRKSEGDKLSLKLGKTKGSLLSACSVFSKCPSDANCMRKQMDGSGVKETRSDASCTGKGMEGDNAKETCADECKASHTEKRTCSACDMNPEYANTCEGCHYLSERFATKKTCSTCNAKPEYANTCEGCRYLWESSATKGTCSTCDMKPEYANTCEGCRYVWASSATKGTCSTCNMKPEYANACEGCRHLWESCAVHAICPECPGCNKPCEELDLCPNCRVCNSEILTDTKP